MKKFFLICVALIAFIATNASGGNQYQTDQLRTCIVTQAQPQIMPGYFMQSQQTFIQVIVSVVPAQQSNVQLELSDGWRAPYWKPSLVINCSYNSSNLKDAYCNREIPIPSPDSYAINRKNCNYNIDYSYGLRN